MNNQIKPTKKKASRKEENLTGFHVPLEVAMKFFISHISTLLEINISSVTSNQNIIDHRSSIDHQKPAKLTNNFIKCEVGSIEIISYQDQFESRSDNPAIHHDRDQIS